jgi:hypothetical protein
MSETRALRDKLEELQAELRRTKEHLEKLRAHQSRERESLGQELGAARRDVAGLRTRLEQLEARESEPRLVSTVAPRPAPAVLDRSGSVPTSLLALVQKPDRTEEAILKLARLLKLSPVDVRFRLTPMEPAVLTRLPTPEARAVREALRAEGFMTVIAEVPPRAAGGLMTVRNFSLGEQGLSLESTRGERQEVPYARLRLLIRGRRNTTVVEMREETPLEVESDRPREQVKKKFERVEQFLWIYGEGLRAAFTLETRFSGLSGARPLSAFESLQALTEQLRQRAPHTVLDERLMQAPRFTLPLVDEDRGQELLGDLLYQAVQEGLWT